VPWSVVACDPQLVARGVVLDRGIVIIRPYCTDARSGNIYIARGINSDGSRMVIVIRRPIVACDPELVARCVVFDRGIIITIEIAGTWADARSRHIDIA